MPRGTQFGQLITMFREETFRAVNPALGQNELPSIKAILRRTYRRLHSDFDWPHLWVQREKILQAGQQYYSYPLDLSQDRIVTAHIRENGGDYWYPLQYGINAIHYSTVHSSQGETEDFPYCWEIYENDQFEVWPVPETSGHTLRFEGVARPKPLVDESEIVDLDDDLIVLYAATEMLTKDRSPDAEQKAQQARAHYMALRSNSQKDKTVDMRVSGDRSGAGPNIDIKYADRRD